MKSTYNNVIPSALETKVAVQRVPGEGLYQDHRVVAWASVNGGPLEALVDVNNTGELVPISELRDNAEDMFVVHPSPLY